MTRPRLDRYSGLLLEQGATGADAVTQNQLSTTVANNVGKGLQIGFDGTLSNNIITFEPPSTSGTYNIKQDFQYEVDLNFPAVGTIDDDTQLVIHNNNETIQFITPTHKDSSTSATFADMKQMMAYDANSGYRWLFQARCKVTSNNIKVLLVYPVIINFADIPEQVNLPITNQEMLDAETDDTPMYRGRQIKTGDLFMCADDNGYVAGHVYRWTGVVGSEWEDRTIYGLQSQIDAINAILAKAYLSKD